jgi:hypothetical protein
VVPSNAIPRRRDCRSLERIATRLDAVKYLGSCHCGAVRFALTSEPITSGIRCNCSICIRKGCTWSASYYAPSAVEISGAEALATYQFGDRDVEHRFCTRCGISVLNVVAKVPADYTGPARPGDHRVNLGCIDALDHAALEVTIVDGRSF